MMDLSTDRVLVATLLFYSDLRTESASSNDIRNLGYLLTHYLKVDEISMSS